jgi:hypothetical protein
MAMPHAPAAHEEPPLAPVPHRLVASWPVGAFIENIAVLADGTFALSLHNRRQIVRVTRDGSSAPWAELPVSPAGLVAYRDGAFVVAGEIGTSPHYVYEVFADGRAEPRLTVPDTIFLNGFTPVSPTWAVTVDSLRGEVIGIDVQNWTCRVLFRDERLGKISDEPMLPGANGVKAADGCLFITNTDRALVLRAALTDDMTISGLAVVAEALRGDDLAVDTLGRLYITNHIHNTLTRLEADGSGRVAVAGPEQRMPGCTACAFHPDEPGALYVTTTGGLVMPFNGVVQEAKLVRLEVGAAGRPLPRLQ